MGVLLFKGGVGVGMLKWQTSAAAWISALLKGQKPRGRRRRATRRPGRAGRPCAIYERQSPEGRGRSVVAALRNDFAEGSLCIQREP